MKRKVKKYLSLLLAAALVFTAPSAQIAASAQEEAQEIGLQAPHALLMETATGRILYEKDADTPVPPASVTKIMTMLLIFDALEEGKIQTTDEVTVSERAASMGGSQVFLEPGEKQTVDTMLKCIAIASANDACVAMAELVAGSEEAFVARMNERAGGLGMKNTNFVNCNGLDADGHLISAKDVALMSRELLKHYPQVHDYCTVWMEKFTHETAKGKTEFGLNNTNKLLRQYEYCTGLKTGSTAKAGFCISASAEKDGMELVAVIMGGESGKSRFQDAKTLLAYGYANYQLYRDTDKEREQLQKVRVDGGTADFVQPVYEGDFVYLLGHGEQVSQIERKLTLPESVKAPVKKGTPIGSLEYFSGDKKLGETALLAGETVAAAGYRDYLKRVWLAWMP